MRLTFCGKVSVGDPCRVADAEEDNGAIRIGETDLVTAIEEAKFSEPVTFAIASDFLLNHTTFEGALRVSQGWGYSEWTPMDPDELFVGPHDILAQFKELDGKDVTVWIADEPLNLLEGVVIRDETDPRA